ncbi:hypothetical protein GCM10010377_35190 [Streptomyces viridiviolaceus]|nr:hypothetical protein GCM10010377_35190 [Streptomyces viridiviolaceus]
MLLSHSHAARSAETGEPVVHRHAPIVVSMRQASRLRASGGRGFGTARGNGGAFKYVHPLRAHFPRAAEGARETCRAL